MTADSFLADLAAIRPLPSWGAAANLKPLRLIGPGPEGFEIAIADAAHKPTQEARRTGWALRQGERAAPSVLGVIYGCRGALCPAGETPPVFRDLDIGQLERICRTALAEPSRHAASRFLWSILPEIKESNPLSSSGMADRPWFRSPGRRSDWPQAQKTSKNLLKNRGRAFLEELAFRIAPTNQRNASARSSRYVKGQAPVLDR